MIEKSRNVRILIPEFNPFMDHAVTRVYASDLTLIGEALSGESINVPLGENYIASALAMNGKPLGLPTKFSVSDEAGRLSVTLEMQASSDPEALTDDQPGWEATEPEFVACKITYAGKRIGYQIEVKQNEFFAHDPAPVESRINYALRFPGPERGKRIACVPYDIRSGSQVLPKVKWSKARTLGLFLPVFDFGDPTINALQNALRYKRSPVVRPIVERTLKEMARDAMKEKVRSPLAATLGGLILLQDEPEQLMKIETWTANLFNWFPWLPDAHVLRVEVLAKLGRHDEARLLLKQFTLPHRSMPWTRRGLRLLTERLTFYEATRKKTKKEGEPSDAERLPKVSREMLSKVHPACVYCVFEEPHLETFSHSGSLDSMAPLTEKRTFRSRAARIG